MSYELIIRDRAQIEIAEIKEWYEDKEEGLGSYFLLCLDASLEAMRRYSTAPRIITHEYRKIFVRKFPVAFTTSFGRARSSSMRSSHSGGI